MPTSPKPVVVLESEGKSHRTKKELEYRRKQEKSMLTGKKIKESPSVKNDVAAHTEFCRVVKLLTAIGKNDALYEALINRYCKITAECLQFEEKRENFYQQLVAFEKKMQDMIDQKDIGPRDAVKTLVDLERSVIDTDKELQAKRKMLLDIEKECCMTVASALRSIPKQAPDNDNPLMQVLMDD